MNCIYKRDDKKPGNYEKLLHLLPVIAILEDCLTYCDEYETG